MFPTDEAIERLASQKPVDGEAAHGYEQRWPDEIELGVEPGGAPDLLLERRDSIPATCRARSGVAPRDRGDLHLATKRPLVETGAREPPE